MAAIDVAYDIGVGSENDIFVNQTGAGNGRAAGMNRTLYSILPSPSDHLARRLPVLHAAQANLAQHGDTRGSKVAKILLHHAVFNHWGAGVNSYAARAK